MTFYLWDACFFCAYSLRYNTQGFSYVFCLENGTTDYNDGSWDNNGRGYGRGGYARGRGLGFRGRGRGGYGGLPDYQLENNGYDDEVPVPVRGRGKVYSTHKID